MTKNVLFACCATLALTSCDQNLSATVYMRDVNELIAATQEKSLPIDVDIEIMEMGIAKQCSKPDTVQLVEAVASVFDNASLVGCEVVSGSMKDKMVIKARTLISLALTNEVVPGENLIHFAVQKTEEPNRAFLTARFNKEKYASLQKKLKQVNPMASVDIEDARISVKLHNDERSPATVYAHTGVFADGDPVDNIWEAKADPREEVSFRFGDVKMGFLAKWGWAGVANIGTEVPAQ